MSKETDNLKLFKYEPEKDGNRTFNITQALNENWDKIDKFSKNSNTGAMPVFCFNAGAVDAKGEAALLTLEKATAESTTASILTLHSPAVCTSSKGETYTITADATLDISSFASGKYNIFYDPVSSQIEIYSNIISISKSQPAVYNINDIWINTSIMPYVAKIKQSETKIEETQLIPCGILNITDNGMGTITNNKYNISQYLAKTEFETFKQEINTKTQTYIKKIYINGTSGYMLYSDNTLIQWANQKTENTTINLLKEYANTDYAILGPIFYIQNSGRQTVEIKTTTSFTTGSDTSTTGAGYWMTIGKGA